MNYISVACQQSDSNESDCGVRTARWEENFFNLQKHTLHHVAYVTQHNALVSGQLVCQKVRCSMVNYSTVMLRNRLQYWHDWFHW